MMKKNAVTGDETWVHFFNLSDRLAINMDHKNSKRSVIAKHTLNAKKFLYAIIFSGEGVALEVPVKRAKALLENTTKMWYWRNWKHTIRNGAQSRVSNMSDFYMIMPQPIRLPLLHFFFFFFFFFLQKEKVTVYFYHTLLIHQTLPSVTSSSFWNWYLFRFTEMRLDLLCSRTLPVYLNQRTVTQSGGKFIVWNYAFLVMGTTLRARNKEMCNKLHIERSS